MAPEVSVGLIGLLLGAAVASGLRLYATVAVLGFLGRTGVLELPGGLSALTHSWVIVVAASLYLVEFLADKIPIVDSVWDLVHTFIRVPAAALLAWAAFAGTDVPEHWRLVAALVCGGVALSAHGLKSSTRAVINTNALQDRARFTRSPARTDHDGETIEGRLARRAANWTPAVIHRAGNVTPSSRDVV